MQTYTVFGWNIGANTQLKCNEISSPTSNPLIRTVALYPNSVALHHHLKIVRHTKRNSGDSDHAVVSNYPVSLPTEYGNDNFIHGIDQSLSFRRRQDSFTDEAVYLVDESLKFADRCWDLSLLKLPERIMQFV